MECTFVKEIENEMKVCANGRACDRSLSANIQKWFVKNDLFWKAYENVS